MVGSLFSWKSLLTKRSTSDDFKMISKRYSFFKVILHTFPTAASPSKTSFTLLLGFGAVASAIVRHTKALKV
jgi:hypothetical protein